MSKDLSFEHPSLDVGTADIQDNAVVGAFRRLTAELSRFRRRIAEVVNDNRLRYVSQNAAPTPGVGQIWLWKDSDAGSGTSTHYLVYNDAGTVRTFESKEKVA